MHTTTKEFPPAPPVSGYHAMKTPPLPVLMNDVVAQAPPLNKPKIVAVAAAASRPPAQTSPSPFRPIQSPAGPNTYANINCSSPVKPSPSTSSTVAAANFKSTLEHSNSTGKKKKTYFIPFLVKKQKKSKNTYSVQMSILEGSRLSKYPSILRRRCISMIDIESPLQSRWKAFWRTTDNTNVS